MLIHKLMQTLIHANLLTYTHVCIVIYARVHSNIGMSTQYIMFQIDKYRYIQIMLCIAHIWLQIFGHINDWDIFLCYSLLMVLCSLQFIIIVTRCYKRYKRYLLSACPRFIKKRKSSTMLFQARIHEKLYFPRI